MALIKCPECGKKVSDQLKRCNNCGYKLKEFDFEKIKKPLIIGIFVALMFALGITSAVMAVKTSRERYYRNLLVAAGTEMYTAGTEAELYCYDISKVWYKAIYDDFSYGDEYYKYKSDDFNVSVNLYLTINESDLDKLKEKQSRIQDLISRLQNNPSDKYKDAYSIILELYGSFNKLVNQAINPTGNYNDYNTKYHQYSEDLNSYYDQLVVLIPDMKNANNKNTDDESGENESNDNNNLNYNVKNLSSKVKDWLDRINSGDNVVTVIASSTCPHCQNYKPIIEKVCKDKNIKLFFFESDELNGDEYTALTETVELENYEGYVPFTFIVKNKKVVEDYTGEQSESDTIEMFEKAGIN